MTDSSQDSGARPARPQRDPNEGEPEPGRQGLPGPESSPDAGAQASDDVEREDVEIEDRGASGGTALPRPQGPGFFARFSGRQEATPQQPNEPPEQPSRPHATAGAECAHAVCSRATAATSPTRLPIRATAACRACTAPTVSARAASLPGATAGSAARTSAVAATRSTTAATALQPGAAAGDSSHSAAVAAAGSAPARHAACIEHTAEAASRRGAPFPRPRRLSGAAARASARRSCCWSRSARCCSAPL